MATFSRTLSPGMTGQDVLQLQRWLNANGYLVAPAGQPGGPGAETDYFGPSTQAALQKFQAANGIVSNGAPGTTGYGNFGPQTMAKMNGMVAATPAPGTAGAAAAAANISQPKDMTKLDKRYGYGINRAAENHAVSALDGMLNLLTTEAAGSTGISKSVMNKIVNDEKQVAFYANALTYGGYSLQDVYRDIVKEGLEMSGKDSLVAGASPISAAIEAREYKASPAYDAVANNPNLAVSPTIAGLDSSVLTLPVLQLPAEAFKQIEPLPDPTSRSFHKMMEEFKSAAYESALEISQAQNETQHTQAVTDWNNFKKEAESRMGITLSDNAVSAWSQINQFQQQAAQNGIAGTGLEAHEIDQYLKKQMNASNQTREYYETYEDQKMADFYKNYASPNEIAALIATDPDKARAWGLVANSEISNYLSMDNLQKLYPDADINELQSIRDRYLDENGNLRSQLYSNYANANESTKGNYRVWQTGKVIQEHEDKVNEQLKEYSNPNDPFLQPKGSLNLGQKSTSKDTSATPTKTSTAATPTSTNSQLDEIKRKALEIQAAIPKSTSSTYTSTPAPVTKAPTVPAPLKSTSTPSGGMTPVPGAKGTTSSAGMSVYDPKTAYTAPKATTPLITTKPQATNPLVSAWGKIGSAFGIK